jgi:voltage-gated potassium channel
LEFVIEGHLVLPIRKRLMESKISALRVHATICGFGRVGSRRAEALAQSLKPFVVLDEREEHARKCST